MVAMRDSSGSALAVGRFAGWEPLGFEAGDNNWYRFVANGPTAKTDPSGLWRYHGGTDGDGHVWPNANIDIDPQYPENDARRFCPRWRRQLDVAQKKACGRVGEIRPG